MGRQLLPFPLSLSLSLSPPPQSYLVLETGKLGVTHDQVSLLSLKHVLLLLLVECSPWSPCICALGWVI